MGDRFYLCENKILCEYDYEERLVFANMAYNPSSLAHIRRQVGNLQVGPRPHPSLSLSRNRCSFYFLVYTLIENARSQEKLLCFVCQFVLNRVFVNVYVKFYRLICQWSHINLQKFIFLCNRIKLPKYLLINDSSI